MIVKCICFMYILAVFTGFKLYVLVLCTIWMNYLYVLVIYLCPSYM